MTRAYIYSSLADADLRAIIRYTVRQWGTAQARAYAHQIDQAAAALAEGRGPFKDWNAVLPGLRVKAVASHFVFCVHRPGRSALIMVNPAALSLAPGFK